MTPTSPTINQEQIVPPTKEQLIVFLSEQIEVKELQAKLQHLNRNIAVDRADELEAFAKATHFAKPKDQVTQHVVTEQDMINNPDLATQNIKVGDTIGIPVPMMDEFLREKETASAIAE